MIVLAIDPGRYAGWALSEPKLSGAIDHELSAMYEWHGELRVKGMRSAWLRLDKTERLKRTLGAYLEWLSELIDKFGPDLLIVEQQFPGAGMANTGCLAYRGVTLAAAGCANLACLECHPHKWRPYLAGRDYNASQDHQLAAECMLAWAQKQKELAA